MISTRLQATIATEPHAPSSTTMRRDLTARTPSYSSQSHQPKPPQPAHSTDIADRIDTLTDNHETMVADDRSSRAIPAEDSACGALSTAPNPTEPPIPVQLFLPPLPAGCTASISPGADGSICIAVAPPPLAYTLEQACERLPNKPHPDTLRAHLERAGIPIGMCGRTPLVTEDQLRRALRLVV